MNYTFISFLSLFVIANVHFLAPYICRKGILFHNKFLSIGSGIAIAYVFIDLLPKLSRNEGKLRAFFDQFFPYLEHHVYIMALLGFLLFFVVDRSENIVKKKSTYFCISLGSYSLFNFFVGYAIADQNNTEVQPLYLFTFAMALHYFMNDYSLTESHGKTYNHLAKWILVCSLFFGWLVGLKTEISASAIALVNAFISGGVIMNVTRHELSLTTANSCHTFLISALLYALVLLNIG